MCESRGSDPQGRERWRDFREFLRALSRLWPRCGQGPAAGHMHPSSPSLHSGSRALCSLGEPLGARRGSLAHRPLRQAGPRGLSAGGALPCGAGALAKPFAGRWGPPPPGGSCRGGVPRPPGRGQEISSWCQAASGLGVSAWLQQSLPSPPWPPAQRGLLGPPHPFFLLQHWLCRPRSGETWGEQDGGERQGLPRSLGTPLPWQSRG